MSDILKPYIINFSKIGEPGLGYISLAEKETLPFVPKRIYWTYFTPEDVERGHHSHFKLEQLLIAAAGRIQVSLITLDGEEHNFLLDTPNKALFIPKMCWRVMKYSHNAVQICIASLEYSEADYIRNIDEFKNLIKKDDQTANS
jgi:hypothetical protein